MAPSYVSDEMGIECLQIDHAHTNHNLYMAVLFVLLLECHDHAMLFTNFIVTFVSVMQMTEICLTCGLTNEALDDCKHTWTFAKKLCKLNYRGT